MFTVTWGEDYLADCARLGPYTHSALRAARESLADEPYAGEPSFGDFRELEVTEQMGLFHVMLAYVAIEPFVILLGVRDLRSPEE